jgi:hypothetical protein
MKHPQRQHFVDQIPQAASPIAPTASWPKMIPTRPAPPRRCLATTGPSTLRFDTPDWDIMPCGD